MMKWLFILCFFLLWTIVRLQEMRDEKDGDFQADKEQGFQSQHPGRLDGDEGIGGRVFAGR